MLAHIVVLPGVPGFVPWLVAAFEVAVFVVLVFGKRVQRYAALGVGVAALIALAVLGGFAQVAPVAPAATLTLADPPLRTTTPVLIVVCSNDLGSLFSDGRVVAVSSDGRQIALMTSVGPIALPLRVGWHMLSAELVDSAHRVFSPRIEVQERVDVTSVGTPPPPARCR